MKVTKMTLLAALAVGGWLTLSPAGFAQDIHQHSILHTAGRRTAPGGRHARPGTEL